MTANKTAPTIPTENAVTNTAAGRTVTQMTAPTIGANITANDRTDQYNPVAAVFASAGSSSVLIALRAGPPICLNPATAYARNNPNNPKRLPSIQNAKGNAAKNTNVS